MREDGGDFCWVGGEGYCRTIASESGNMTVRHYSYDSYAVIRKGNVLAISANATG